MVCPSVTSCDAREPPPHTHTHTTGGAVKLLYMGEGERHSVPSESGDLGRRVEIIPDLATLRRGKTHDIYLHWYMKVVETP